MEDFKNREFSIIIGADILPTPSNCDLFSQGKVTALLGNELWQIINNADFRVFNLEGPLIDDKSPILKAGPVLKAPEASITGLKAMGTDLLSLSNNHILDHGAIGVRRTLKLAKEKNIACVGVGVSQKERSQAFFFQKNSVRVGIYSCCEHEESVVPEGEYGANPYDTFYSYDDVRNFKKECDYLIILYHGGKEHFRYPSPMLMRRFRRFAEMGADIVIAQHTHCIGSYEYYKNSLLLYGQGNFIFDRVDNEFADNGLLLEITFGTDSVSGYRYRFVPVQKQKNVVRLANDKTAENILNSLEKRSLKLQDEAFIQEEYNKKADEYITNYLLCFHGHPWIGKLLKIIFRGKLNKYINKCVYSNKTIARIKNYISCEAHQELLLTGLNRVIAKKQ